MAYPPAADPGAPADTEEATPAPGAAESADDNAAGDQEEGSEEEVLKNHLYLPPNFPMDKKPVAGKKEKFLLEVEYVEDNDKGEHCYKVDTVDGVPIPEEDENSTEEAESGDEAGMNEEAQGSDENQTPEAASPPSKVSDVTALILSGGKKK